MQDKVFLDTNILLYAFSSVEIYKHDIAVKLVLSDAVISTQVINEVTVNLIKKFNFSEDKVSDFIQSSYNRYEFAPLNLETFLKASSLRKEYLLSYYDSVIVAAALMADCRILYSEDMQHELLVEKSLKIVNPFKKLHINDTNI